MAATVRLFEGHVVARHVWCTRCLQHTVGRVVVTYRHDPTKVVGRYETCRRCRHTRRL